jgi:hypothetical protein
MYKYICIHIYIFINSKFMATLGGQDDNALIIWDVQSGIYIYTYIHNYSCLHEHVNIN